MRQPQLLLLLLIGPVLVMVAFGLSLNLQNILLPRVLVVVESGKRGRQARRAVPVRVHDCATVAGITDDAEAARQQILRGQVDAVIDVPSDPLESVAQGEQASLKVTYNTINPVFGTAVPQRSYSLVSGLNLDTVQEGIARGIGDTSTAQEQVDELDQQLENVDRAVEDFSSEEARTATTNFDGALASLEQSLEVVENVPGIPAKR